MSDNDVNKEKKFEPQQVVRSDDKDWFLQSLVNLVNRFDFEYSVTLNLGGQLVSGTVISGKKYFEEFSNTFTKNMTDNDSAEQLKASFKENEKFYEYEDNEPYVPPHFIHLKNAQVYSDASGKAIPQGEGILWRGLISSADGFFLGRLAPNE